jgi:chemotaxis protein methyltransferase CheR
VADAAATCFLARVMPRVGLHWPAFRRVQRQVWRRLERRRAELGLADLDAYERYLEAHPAEWDVLAGLCRITISRFWRDGAVWTFLVEAVLPALAARASVSAWSAGCGAGEEPYTLAIAWQQVAGPIAPIAIVGTDIDDGQLARARGGCYPGGALGELPPALRAAAFDEDGDLACVRPALRAHVRFERRDLRAGPPGGPYDLILCRNLAFSYFDEAGQRAAAAVMRAALRPGGALVVGRGEVLPDGTPGFAPLAPCVYGAVTAPAR